jgi:hypothetical protein
VKVPLYVAQKPENLDTYDVLAMKQNIQAQPAATGDTVRAEIVEMRSLR